jgi:hypothetical protein
MASTDGRLPGVKVSSGSDFIFLHENAQESAVSTTGWTFRQLVTAHKFRMTGVSGEYAPDQGLKDLFAKIDHREIRYLVTQAKMFETMFQRVVPKKADAKPDDPNNLTPCQRKMLTTACQRFFSLTLQIRSPKCIVDYIYHQLPPGLAYAYREVSRKRPFHHPHFCRVSYKQSNSKFFKPSFKVPLIPLKRYQNLERYQKVPGRPGSRGLPWNLLVSLQVSLRGSYGRLNKSFRNSSYFVYNLHD